MANLNTEVTEFIKSQKHPLDNAIQALRQTVLSTNKELIENIKWNSPNYSVGVQDRFTLRTQPPKQLQLIFHRGAKVQTQPVKRLIDDDLGLLVWKENDRAVLVIKSLQDIEENQEYIKSLIKSWITATS